MVWDAVLLRVLGEGKLGAGSRVFEEKSEVEEQVRWFRNTVSQATPVMTANSSRARRSIALAWARALQQTARNAFNSPEHFNPCSHLSENLF